MITKRICPACGNNSAEILHNISMDLPEGIRLDHSYNIVCCDTCGNCYADTSASASDYDDYYTNHNIYGNGWQYNSSGIYDFSVITNLLNTFASKNTRIFDLGCGNGKLLMHLRNDGFTDLTGIDPGKATIDNLQKNSLNGIIGSIYEKPLEDIEKADVVIFSMVLEHLLLPKDALMNIRTNYLKKNGYIIVTWPHFEDLIVDNSPILNNFNHEHINFFSVKTADILFSRVGFQRIKSHISLAVSQGSFVEFSNIVLYRETDLSSNDLRSSIVKDEKLRNSISEYVNRLSRRENQKIQTISELVQSQKPIAIWGTGAYLMHLTAISDLKKCNIVSIVDNNPLKQGTSIWDYLIASPQTLLNFTGTVLVAVMLYGKEIEEQIRNMGNDQCRIVLL